MTWRNRLRNPFVQQYLVEILFPLIGFLFFDWSLAILAVFYLVDQLASESAFWRRLHRVATIKNSPSYRFLLPVIAFFFTAFAIELFFLYGHFKTSPGSETLYEELWAFVKEELWILFPLVILLYHFKDQFTFYMPRRYLLYDLKKMMVYRALLIALVAVLLIAGIQVWRNISIPDIAILILFLVIKIIFDLTVARFVDRKSKL